MPDPKRGTMSDILPKPNVTTTETFRVGDLGPRFPAEPAQRWNSASDVAAGRAIQTNPVVAKQGAYDSPFNKGLGFYGGLRIPGTKDGVMSELSQEDDIGPNGSRVDYPLIYPGISEANLKYLLSIQDGDAIPRDLSASAKQSAIQRMNQGKSPYAAVGEQDMKSFPTIKRLPVPLPVPDRRVFRQGP